MDQMCRVCLGHSDTLVAIFDKHHSEEAEEISLAEMLNECAECKVRIDDELPKMICMDCSVDAITAFKFKRRYEQSYKLLTLKVEKRELELNADNFCDMLEAEEWELPIRDADGIKIELQESEPEQEQEQQHTENQAETPSGEESFLEHMSPPFAGFEEKVVTSHRYPVRQSTPKSYVYEHKDLDTETESNLTDFSVNDDEDAHADVFKQKQEFCAKPTKVEEKLPHKCLECPKVFDRLETLKSHTRTHTADRPFACPHCPKLFAKSHHVRDHINIHNGQRPHQCPHCPKAFSQKSNLQAHIYIHAGEGPYKCTHCKKSFCRNYDLKAHLRIHTGDRPYQCSQCSKAFNRRRDLERHRRIHTGEHPYKCTSCSLEFGRKDQLKAHTRGHEIDKLIPRVKREKK